MSLRECLKLQIVPRYSAMNLTAFGRARMMTGEHPIYGSEPEFYMLYWLKLPIFGHYYHIAWDREQWGQRVLQWHGKHGFRFDWCYAPNLGEVT